MPKEYVLRDFSLEDERLISAIVKESNSLICTPSSIPDLYNVNNYKVVSLTGQTELKAILDNNVVTHIIPLVDGRKELTADLSIEAKIACAIMCFLIISGIEAIPNIALHEVPNDPEFPSKERQDYYFRIADHLSPKVFADLALGRINDIPKQHYEYAKSAVDTNTETQKDIKRTSYKNKLDDRYKIIYMNLMKIWLFYKTDHDQSTRLNKYLEWNFKNSMSDTVSIIFMIIILSDKRIGKMIKNINSENPDIILKHISNTTWDLYYLTALEYAHIRSDSNEIWFFFTRDKVLKEISQFLFVMENENSITSFISKYYAEKETSIFMSYVKNINSRKDRDTHTQKIRRNLQSTISNLESEIQHILQS